MDQLRVIFDHVKKHHFWLLAGLCLAIGIAAWMKAAGNLSGEYSKRKSAITSKFNALDQILSEPVFPNAQWKEGADTLTAEQKQKVAAAWKLVYDEQAQWLNWPESLTFAENIRSAKRGKELPRSYCTEYMNTIQQEFPKLLQIVGAESHNAETPSTPTPMVQERVIWDDNSQKAIEDELRWETAPSSLEVWLTQENLWVYRVLLTIIQQVNAGSIVPPVKEINELLIAQKASEKFQDGMAPARIDRPKTAGAATSDSRMPERPGMPAQTGEMPPLDQNRYVDAEGNPLPGGSGADQAFRRMPIFLELKVDQRQIPRLLAECANSPLPVEVRQLRITSSGNRPAAASSPSSGNYASAGSSRGSTAAVAPYDVHVEIAGIIYIYNPPDTAKLGSGEEQTAAMPIVPGG